MNLRRRSAVKLIPFSAAVLTVVFASTLLSATAAAQLILYDNGPDPGNLYGWPICNGYRVSNTFTLTIPSVVNAVNVSLYDVNAYNVPHTLDWKILDLNRHTIAEGSNVSLIKLEGPVVNYFLLNQWLMQIPVSDLELPPGTYWLELSNATNRWGTPTWWGEDNGPSKALFNGTVGGEWKHGGHDHGGSESFQIVGAPQVNALRHRDRSHVSM